MASTPDDKYKEPDTETWRDRYARIGVKPDMPEIEGAEYLLVHLNNLGWASTNGMGATPLSFTEIKAYTDLTEYNLTSDEVLLIRKMSENYVNHSSQKDPKLTAPYKSKK